MHRLMSANRPLARLALTLTLVCSAGLAAEDAVTVSLAELTGAKERYDGKAVVVSGYLAIGFEKRSLCPTRQQAAGKDCVWLSGETSNWRDLSGKYVTLRGTYSRQYLGHLGCCSGAVRAAERPIPAKAPAPAR